MTESSERGGSLLSGIRQKGFFNLVRIVSQLGARRAWSVLYGQWLRGRGMRIGSGVQFFGRIHVFGDPRRVTIGDRCLIHRGVTFWTHDYGQGAGEIVLGRDVMTLHNVTFNSWVRISVGDHTAFGDGCYVQDNDHGTEPGIPMMKQPLIGVPIAIARDVWFGARCIVLKGVTVGEGAVIGAGSVVVKPIPAGVVAVGVPARPIKRRGGGEWSEGRAA